MFPSNSRLWFHTLGQDEAQQYLQGGQDIASSRPTRFQFLAATFSLAQIPEDDRLSVKMDGLTFLLKKPVPTMLAGTVIKWRAIGLREG